MNRRVSCPTEDEEACREEQGAEDRGHETMFLRS